MKTAAALLLTTLLLSAPVTAQAPDISGQEAAAVHFAQAVQNRDGIAQAHTFTPRLKHASLFYLRKILRSTVTGVSSPWVQEYTGRVSEDGASAELFFHLVTSAGSYGTFPVRVWFENCGGEIRISRADFGPEMAPYIALPPNL